MFCIDNAAKAKKSARSLEKFFKKSGVKLAHGHALNAVASMAGFTDWNAMLESLNQAAPAPAPVKEPSIFDIDFQKVSTIRVWGSEYNFNIDPSRWEVLQSASQAERATLMEQDDVVIELESLNDEVYGDEELTVAELLDFKWNSARQCFTNSQGGDLELQVLKPYEFAAAPNAFESSEQESASTSEEGNAAEPEFKRYKVAVYCDDRFVGTHVCVAKNKVEAEEAAMEELWDDRVERYEARIFAGLLDDDEGGHFEILVGGVTHDDDPYFSEACRKAKEISEANPDVEVVVMDEEGNQLLKLGHDPVAEYVIYFDKQLTYVETTRLSIARKKANDWAKENPGVLIELRNNDGAGETILTLNQ